MRFSQLAALGLLLASPLPAQQVALTFDDLPSHGALPPGVTRLEIARELVTTLQAAGGPPSFGFLNAQKVDRDPELRAVLELWREAGLPLGSHAYSHMDLHANTVEAYEQDITRNEPLVAELMGDEAWRWFRYPYLREGNTVEKRRAVRKILADRGYRIAETSLDFEDYLWNAPYARCVAQGDEAAIERLEESYLDVARRYIFHGQQLSQLLFGRDVAHILLLHTGAFNARMLPRLLELLDAMGFRRISLEEADSDPAYRTDWDVATERGKTLLEQGVKAKGLAAPPVEEKPLERLRKICR